MRKLNTHTMQKSIANILFTPIAVMAFFLSTSIFAVDISIFTDGTNEAELQGIYVDGVRYQHINGILTQFSMHGYNTDTYQIVPDGWSGQNGDDAVALLEDDLLGTGYGGLYGVGTGEIDEGVGLTFNSPVTNRPGPDILVFESSSTDWNDKIFIDINGIQIGYTNSGSGTFTDTGITVDRSVWSDQNVEATSLSILRDTCNFATAGGDSTVEIGYLAVDLSDHGVADDATISTILLRQWGGPDLVAVVGLTPDPIDIEVVTDGSNNARLEYVTVGDKDYVPICGTLTGFSMYVPWGNQTWQVVPTGWSGQNGTAAAALLEDRFLSTAFADLRGQYTTGDKGITLSFDRPVENRPGPDIMVFERNNSDWGTGIYSVINGITGYYGGTTIYTDCGIKTDGHLWVDNNTIANTLTALLSCDFSLDAGTSLDSDIGYLAIYLEDYGVAQGDTVTEINLYADSGPDIAGVFGLGTPSGTVLIIQ